MRTRLVWAIVLLALQVPVAPQNVRLLNGTTTPTSTATTPPAPIINTVYPPPSGAGNAYFESLLQRADLWKSYSMRDAAQLKQYAASQSMPMDITYDPTHDPDPRRQDAAKVVIPTVAVGGTIPVGVNSIKNQVRLPTGTTDGHTYLYTWDAWYGREYSYHLADAGNASVSGWKTFQLDAPASWGGRAAIRWEVNNQIDRDQDSGGMIRCRYYTYSTTDLGPNIGTGLDQLKGPYANPNYVIQTETWIRYWALIEQIPNDYDRISLWAADSTHNPVLIIDRLQVTFNDGNQKFWLEFNTSTEGLFDRTTATMLKPGTVVPADANPRPPYVAYVRNLAILRDVANPTALMARPQ